MENFDPTAFLEKMGDSGGNHVTPSGRTYRTIQSIEDSKLLLSAHLEPVHYVTAKGVKVVAVAVVLRFAVKGPDRFPQLTTRPSPSSSGYSKDLIYKDRKVIPFCLAGNAPYVCTMYRERKVQLFVDALLATLVPDADSAAIEAIFDGMLSLLQPDDPVVVKVL